MRDDEPAATRAELIRQLLDSSAELPTSALGRLGRTAWSALRNRQLFAGGEGPADAELADRGALARLVSSLGQLKGIAMKMGQLMSYVDLALPEDVREALSVLQTHAQPMSFDEVRAILRRERPDAADALLAQMTEEPIAAASIGQVHRSRLDEAGELAVKVQYPGIEDAIRSDFRVAKVGPAVASLVYPGADIEGFIEEARARLLEECDYEHEARMQARFGRIYADHPVIEIPDVHEAYGSKRVLTTGFAEGLGFEAFLDQDPSQQSRDRLGEALFEFYIGTLFEHGLFNGDPHPGNYIFPDDGRVVLLDHGCVRAFDQPMVDHLARISTAVREDDPDALRVELEAMGVVEVGDEEQFEIAEDLLRSVTGPMRRDERGPIEVEQAMEMRDVFARKRDLMRISLPPAFLYLFRIRFGLVSVLARVGAEANWGELEARYADAASA